MRTRKESRSPKPSEETDIPWFVARGPGSVRRAGRERDKTGKWLVWAPRADVDEVWGRVEAATKEGKLGCDAKVATAYDSSLTARAGQHVLCIYTADYEDHDNVGRVLCELRAMGFADRMSYETDDATLAGRYGPGSAIYVSQPGSLEFEDR
jgi:hypothetical protein